MPGESLFEKYGGIETVAAVVHDFYEDVLADDTLSPFFEGVDMDSLIEHQVMLFSQYMGGPANYSGRELRDAHTHIRITTAHFDKVAEILQAVLGDYNVAPDDIMTIMAVVETTRSAIVNEG